MNGKCPRLEEVAAFLADELSPGELVDFESHLASCADCRAATDSTDRLLGRLRGLPAARCTRDLAPLVLERVRQPELERIPTRWQWQRAAAIAAGVALLGFFTTRETLRHGPAPARPVVPQASAQNEQALDWFVRAQEPDGSWAAERWGGRRNYAPALTALPLLALVTAANSTADRDAAAERAVASLLAIQNADGGFGDAFQGSPYNDSIAAFALLNAWRTHPGVVPKPSLDAAVSALVKRQQPDGGWGYLYSPLANSSITQWHIQALELAASLGWSDARSAWERGVRWLSVHDVSRDASADPADSTGALLSEAASQASAGGGEINFYRVYFAAAALKQAHTPAALQRLASLQNELLSRQVKGGAEGGSWAPDDQWGLVGGRLYSTALASLSLDIR